MTRQLRHALLIVAFGTVHRVRRRSVLVGRDHVGADHARDPGRPLRLAQDLAPRQVRRRLDRFQLQRLLHRLGARRVLRGGARHPDRRDGGACLRALPLLFNSLVGLILVYVAFQLPITVYILESFFARIPSDLFDAARMDGYGELEIFWRITMPVALPALSTTIIVNTILLWNEFLYAVVLITDEAKRTLPLGIQKFMGDQLDDVGIIATGLMIAIVPVVLLYAFYSEKLIQA